jgi:hypothetical protein
VTPLYLPLVALSAVSVGGLALVPSSSPRRVAVPWGTSTLEESTPEVREVSGADGTSLGAAPDQAMTLGVCLEIG